MAKTERDPTAPGALVTDLYELTMAAAYFAEGIAERPATFSCFVRDLPPERGYLVAGGLAEVVTYLERYRFTEDDLAALGDLDLFADGFLSFLADVRFDGRVRAVPEGRIVFAGEPLLEIDAPIVMGQLVETFVLNQVTTQTTLSTKAARFRHAAPGHTVLDFAVRRTQGLDAAMKLVRAVAIVGLDGTSNVAGGTAYGVATSGTMAHSFVQAYEDETEAFRAFARLFGPRTVLLVDTYDTITGVARAIGVATEMRSLGTELLGIRLDSGDLGALAQRSRHMLDDAGFDGMQIFVSGGLDEHDVAALVEQGAPIDGFGVGTQLGVSADVPVLDSVYKLVEFDGRPVRKTSTGKASLPGPKQLWRFDDGSGDVLALAGEPLVAAAGGRAASPMLEVVMEQGRRTPAGPLPDARGALAAANRWFEQDRAALPDPIARLVDPARRGVEPSSGLAALVDRMDREVDEVRAVRTSGRP